MKKIFTLIAIFAVLFGVKCFGQATITYTSPKVFIVGVTVNELKPVVTGGAATGYTVDPQLPPGLSISATTGSITGTPSGISAAADYTISATIAGAISTVKFNITVNYPNFDYNVPASPFKTYFAIPAMAPTGSPMPEGTTFSISPSLPEGLILETNTGVIHGVPTGVSSANYVITATNPAKINISSAVSITVVSSQPSITYTSYNTFIAGVQISSSANTALNQPCATQRWFKKTFRGYHDIDVYDRLGIPVPKLVPTPDPDKPKPVGYSIRPALPDGLNLNMVTGEITGTPTTASPQTRYTVTAYYPFNPSSTFDLNIAVIANPDIDASDASIEFVGQGDIQQSINTGSKIAANTGIGVIYRENSNRHYGLLHNIEVDFSINVASTVDTVKSNFDNNSKKLANPSAFGNSLLLPLNSGQAFSFSFIGSLTKKGGADGNYYRNAAPKPLGGIISGFRVDIAGSNRNWELDTIPAAAGTIRGNIIKSSMLSTYVGVFYEFITPTAKNNFGQNASATFGFGLSARWLLGDAAQGNNPQQFLGTTAKITSFVGPEFQLGLRFYNIKAAVHIPMLPSKANNPIPGLTGTQPTTFIGFSGGFPIDLTKKPAPAP